MNTTIRDSDVKPRVLIVDNNSKFTHGVRLLLQEIPGYGVCEENDMPLRRR
jgi:hypothetical protein